eukprot:359469-Amphidinium_carterae.1
MYRHGRLIEFIVPDGHITGDQGKFDTFHHTIMSAFFTHPSRCAGKLTDEEWLELLLSLTILTRPGSCSSAKGPR